MYGGYYYASVPYASYIVLATPGLVVNNRTRPIVINEEPTTVYFDGDGQVGDTVTHDKSSTIILGAE